MNKALKAWKFIRIIAYILVLIVSMTWLSSHFSSPETYRDAIETLDEQKLTAMGLDVVLASTSTVLTLALDDIATPLANEIADMTDVVFVIICIILAEKFLITTFGWIAFL